MFEIPQRVSPKEVHFILIGRPAGSGERAKAQTVVSKIRAYLS
jgi:hypothetical protein